MRRQPLLCWERKLLFFSQRLNKVYRASSMTKMLLFRAFWYKKKKNCIKRVIRKIVVAFFQNARLWLELAIFSKVNIWKVADLPKLERFGERVWCLKCSSYVQQVCKAREARQVWSVQSWEITHGVCNFKRWPRAGFKFRRSRISRYFLRIETRHAAIIFGTFAWVILANLKYAIRLW